MVLDTSSQHEFNPLAPKDPLHNSRRTQKLVALSFPAGRSPKYRCGPSCTRPKLLGQSKCVKVTSTRNNVRVFWLKVRTMGLAERYESSDRGRETVWRSAIDLCPLKSLARFEPSCSVQPSTQMNEEVQNLVQVRGWSAEDAKLWSLGSNRHLTANEGMGECKNANHRDRECERGGSGRTTLPSEHPSRLGAIPGVAISSFERGMGPQISEAVLNGPG